MITRAARRIVWLCFTLMIMLCLSWSDSPNPPIKFSLKGPAQGTTFLITYYAEKEIFPIDSVNLILQGVDSSVSQYTPNSLISRFNRDARGIKIDQHLKTLLLSALHFSDLTNGAFDITIKPISVLWGFNAVQPSTVPAKRTIRSTLSLVGSNHLILANDSLFKSDPGVMIDLDGIAQGYTVDLLSNFLIEKGVKHFIVELGGEIRTSGSKPDGSLWSVGIEGPMDNAQQGAIIDRELTISGKAVTTSGSYRKFIKIGDRYFSHIINPKTGYPSNNGLISVTVIADDAITADALDNSFMVMGLKNTFRLLHTMPDIGVYMVYKKANGSIADTSNSVFKNYINSTY